eukprot:TRINITY_DN8953_c0_g1_i2.p3 TRINITY_DN8953_c0_g1~~TRINITY_DN8953_c0_g1_i2.p3  ORF type:complete len:164 (-),score=13.80 TRINITY_DN8953_c0_g1_i2:108-599(-)
MASTSARAQEVILYPAYIDVEKSWGGGRRVCKKLAVERPDAREMYDAIARGLHLDARLEMDKKYSRDWLNPGRVRVQLRRTDGVPCNTDIPSKTVLLTKCAELCAKHPERAKRLAEIKKMEAQMFSGGGPLPNVSQKAADKAQASTSGGKGGGKSNKKKGKRK